MVQQSKETFLLVLFGCSFLFYEVQSSIFIVYPFQIGKLNPSKPKFSSRNLYPDNLNNRNVFNGTDIHLVYPLKEELMIMTPTPMEDEQLERTTQAPTTFSDEPDGFMSTFTTTDITDETTAHLQLDSELDSNTVVTSSDADTTDTATTDISIPKTTSINSSIYDTTGPLKFIRKRMYGYSKYSKKYVHDFKEILTTKSPAIIKPKKKYTRKNKTINIGSIKKYVNNGIALDECFVDHKRNTFKPAIKLRKKDESMSINLNIRDKGTSANKNQKTY